MKTVLEILGEAIKKTPAKAKPETKATETKVKPAKAVSKPKTTTTKTK
jgi:hypothetical protein